MDDPGMYEQSSECYDLYNSFLMGGTLTMCMVFFLCKELFQ
jgi:hypothetical protein